MTFSYEKKHLLLAERDISGEVGIFSGGLEVPLELWAPVLELMSAFGPTCNMASGLDQPGTPLPH